MKTIAKTWILPFIITFLLSTTSAIAQGRTNTVSGTVENISIYQGQVTVKIKEPSDDPDEDGKTRKITFGEEGCSDKAYATFLAARTSGLPVTLEYRLARASVVNEVVSLDL